MNALVTFRANAAGNLAATREQRQVAAEQVAANLRTKIFAQLRQLSAAKSQVAPATAAKTAAASGAKSAQSKKETAANLQQGLDRDAFLQLLVMQMRYQDPLEPVENTEMIAQLAQFSALEQMTNLNESFENFATELGFLTGNVDQLNFISAQGLLGKYVSGVDADRNPVSGTVDAVTLENSIVVLTVGEQRMPMTGVLNISQNPPPETAASKKGVWPW